VTELCGPSDRNLVKLPMWQAAWGHISVCSGSSRSSSSCVVVVVVVIVVVIVVVVVVVVFYNMLATACT